MSELNKELCTLVCKEVAWFHEQFKQCRAACHKCGDYRRLEQRLKMYKGDVLFEVQEEMERRGREEAKKDCLEIVDHHIELADMIRGDEDYCLVTTVKGWLELIRIKMKELGCE